MGKGGNGPVAIVGGGTLSLSLLAPCSTRLTGVGLLCPP